MLKTIGEAEKALAKSPCDKIGVGRVFVPAFKAMSSKSGGLSIFSIPQPPQTAD